MPGFQGRCLGRRGSGDYIASFSFQQAGSRREKNSPHSGNPGAEFPFPMRALLKWMEGDRRSQKWVKAVEGPLDHSM